VSMSEERHPGEFPEAHESSFKTGLRVTAIVVGLGLLVLGGVAAYVAWTDPSGVFAKLLAPSALDHPKIKTPEPIILSIDLPPGFERTVMDRTPPMLLVAFGRKSDAGAELILGRVELSKVPAGSSLETQRIKMLQNLEREIEDDMTFRRVADSIATARELTVLGQRSSIEIIHGTRGRGAKRYAKVAGVFSTEQARIAVVFIIPEEEYDEEAVVRMFESIRPLPGDSVPKADVSESSVHEEASSGSANEPARAEAADDDKPDS
jgi:hypothetical protein